MSSPSIPQMLEIVFSCPSPQPEQLSKDGQIPRYLLYPNLLPWSEARAKRFEDTICNIVGPQAALTLIKSKFYTNEQWAWSVECTLDQAKDLEKVEDVSPVLFSGSRVHSNRSCTDRLMARLCLSNQRVRQICPTTGTSYFTPRLTTYHGNI